MMRHYKLYTGNYWVFNLRVKSYFLCQDVTQLPAHTKSCQYVTQHPVGYIFQENTSIRKPITHMSLTALAGRRWGGPGRSIEGPLFWIQFASLLFGLHFSHMYLPFVGAPKNKQSNEITTTIKRRRRRCMVMMMSNNSHVPNFCVV